MKPSIEEIGDAHVATSLNTPLRSDAFEMSDDQKIEAISAHFESIMNILGLDLSDDSLKGTPKRVAKMYVQEIFSGLNPENKPSITLFENKYQYHDVLIEKDISFFSVCEHHFVPIIGRAHIGYISNGEVVGLSKINRLVRYYAKRPQVQERLTRQILEGLKDSLNVESVAVVIDAKHLCVASRGVEDITSSTITSEFSGEFQKEEVRNKFLTLLKSDLNSDNLI